MNYSMFKVTLLMLFGPRFGLQKTFNQLDDQLQKEVVKEHVDTIRFLIIATTMIESMIILYLLMIEWPTNFPLLSALLIIAISTGFFIILILLASVKWFFHTFDMDNRKRMKMDKRLEHKRKANARLVQKVNNWKNR